MKPKAAKFIGFFNLMEAMKKPGCPVCLRILENTHHMMDSFLYESVNDPGLREKIRKDDGFCHRHTWQLARFGDALGGAILFQDILERLMPRLDSHQGKFLSRPPALAELGGQKCVFCRWEDESRDGAIGDIANHLDDPELLGAWNGPARLCIPHLIQVLARSNDDAARAKLLETHRAKYQALCDQMRQFVLEHSGDHRSNGFGAEKDSWLAAIESLVGRFGIR